MRWRLGGYTAYQFLRSGIHAIARKPLLRIDPLSKWASRKVIVILGSDRRALRCLYGLAKAQNFCVDARRRDSRVFKLVRCWSSPLPKAITGRHRSISNIMVWPIMFLFAAFAVSARLPSSPWKAVAILGAIDVSAVRDLISPPRAFVGVPLFLAGWNVAGVGQRTLCQLCGHIAFFPSNRTRSPDISSKRLPRASACRFEAW